MANINLLPWRDEYRQEKKREFVSVLMLLCVLAAVASYVWISFTKSQIENQQSRNNLLKTEIAQLDLKVKEIEQLKKRREELETRIDIIQGLQTKRPLVVRYFDELVRAVPEGLYLNTLSRTADTFDMTGTTQSNNRVSTLMRNLDRSEWFDSPNLKNVIAEEFDLSVQATPPAKNSEGEG